MKKKEIYYLITYKFEVIIGSFLSLMSPNIRKKYANNKI